MYVPQLKDFFVYFLHLTLEIMRGLLLIQQIRSHYMVLFVSPNKWNTLWGETFAGSNFRVMVFFVYFRVTKSPRKALARRSMKVYPTRNVFCEKEGP